MVKGVVFGIAIATAVTGMLIARQSSSGGPGDEMSAAYDAVFNDLELLNSKGPGKSRVPFNPFDTHPGIYPRREAAENSLLITRAALLNAKWQLEEGLFALNRERWRKVTNRDDFERILDAEEKSGRRPVVNLGQKLPRRVSKVAAWWHNVRDKVPKFLFRDSFRGESPVDRALLDFADEAVVAVERHPEKAFEKKSGDWQLYARAIFARNKECLGCHPGVKLNGPIAVAAFAYRKPSP